MRKSLNVFIALTVLLIIFYVNQVKKSTINNELPTLANANAATTITNANDNNEDYNIWIIFTRINVDSPLRFKFRTLIDNLARTSSIPLKYNLIVSKESQAIAENELKRKNIVAVIYYDIETIKEQIEDIFEGMFNHFTSGTSYYSDYLFYISLGLYRIAPKEQTRAVMLDCDLYFKEDIFLLFKQFDGFSTTNLFALAPELSPVYRHVLHNYRQRHPNTTFGDFRHQSTRNRSIGYQGYNSGVILFNLSAIRESPVYTDLITRASVQRLTRKYMFNGHLGDQDFYTLIGFEYPELIKTLECGFNRQLCTWWRDNGYKELFDYYFKCESNIVVLHGNCNARIT